MVAAVRQADAGKQCDTIEGVAKRDIPHMQGDAAVERRLGHGVRRAEQHQRHTCTERSERAERCSSHQGSVGLTYAVSPRRSMRAGSAIAITSSTRFTGSPANVPEKWRRDRALSVTRSSTPYQ